MSKERIEWPKPSPLPETGLAAKYPGDSFPKNDPRILIAEDFAGYTGDGSALTQKGKWDSAGHSYGSPHADNTLNSRIRRGRSQGITANIRTDRRV